ncbi:hypothetical protein AZE42_09359 [Rhizopogon vesiculosus]|uniref:Amidase domain-containing protein n=1 Tax=Rhizopogon vesiculosus TaxID=180088 RepID=A0A1J8QJF4_9AGAM|nr:hypothetical protein AZE42_09359 [Rhizopogon vesiculosus]
MPTNPMKSEHSHVDDDYLQALADNFRLSRAEGIDAAFEKHKLDAHIMPTDRAPLQTCFYLSPEVAAIAGHPMISVPLGFQSGTIEVSPAEQLPLPRRLQDDCSLDSPLLAQRARSST